MKQILFIEDDKKLHHIYKQALKGIDATFTPVTTGKEGLALMKKNPPHLVILDIMLPGGLNGFDVLEQMKKDPTLSRIPVIVLTNLDSERKTAMEIGATDYLVKANITIDEVITKIKTLL